MPAPPPTPIRDILLAEVKKAEQAARNNGPTMQQGSILEDAANQIRNLRPGMLHWQALSPDHESALLTQWGELFRTGLLAWGLNLSNPNPPFVHVTERGMQALANATRDPSNPVGYLRHLDGKATINPIARSYLTEGLECYSAGFFRAGAVMVGGAGESLILELAETVKRRLLSLGQPVPKALNDWRVKTVADALQALLNSKKNTLPKTTFESFEAYWPAFIQQIRTARNEAGHPTSIDPVSPDTVHVALLTFPELARLTDELQQWVINHLS